MNTCCFVGRICQDPELKTTQSGLSVCSFTLAVQRPKVKDTTDFINFVAWRQSAEYLCKYARKGSLVEVAGTLTSRAYEDKNGNKRVAFEVVADALKTLSNGNSNEPKQEPAKDANCAPGPYSASGDVEYVEMMTSDDDLPF